MPDSRSVKVPSPASADERKSAVNERSDSVMYLPLGDDILMPEILADESLPREVVGPFELRSETLAGALQLILADYDISLAFETDEGLDRRITVANLHGELDSVVHRVCSLADRSVADRKQGSRRNQSSTGGPDRAVAVRSKSSTG